MATDLPLPGSGRPHMAFRRHPEGPSLARHSGIWGWKPRCYWVCVPRHYSAALGSDGQRRQRRRTDAARTGRLIASAIERRTAPPDSSGWPPGSLPPHANSTQKVDARNGAQELRSGSVIPLLKPHRRDECETAPAITNIPNSGHFIPKLGRISWGGFGASEEKKSAAGGSPNRPLITRATHPPRRRDLRPENAIPTPSKGSVPHPSLRISG